MASDPVDDTLPDRVELVLGQAVAGGSVIARPDDGPVVLVEGGLPGERVRVRVDRRKPTLWRGTVEDVLEPSSHRVRPPCPNVSRGCGGCDLQHADGGAQLAMKRDIVVDALRRLGRLGHTDPALDLSSIVGHAPPLPTEGFRTTVRGAVDGSGRFAFRHRRGHDLVEPDHCLVAHPLLDELIHDGRFGAATEVTLRVGAGTGERMAVVDPRVDDVALPTDVAVVGVDELRRGRRAWLHEVILERRLRISARSFFQSRPDGAAALVDEVRTAVTEVDTAVGSDGPIVDAYCGVGLLGAFLGEGGRRVIGVERNRSSIADAQENLRSVDATIVAADVEAWRPSPAGVVVADPSRDGLGRRAVGRLTSTGAARLVLVSCDPAALGRDSRLLADAGYRLTRATLVDLFPHTHHVEVVSRFDLDVDRDLDFDRDRGRGRGARG